MFSIINYKNIRIFAAILVFSLAVNAIAQENQAPDTKQALDPNVEFEQTFQQMLKNPSDVDVTLKYAQIAVSLGNYEAAIPPLERLLIFNPNLPKIKLELGVLYYKLDSMKMASSYFEDAAKSKDATDEIKSSAKEYLQKIKG